MDKARNVKGCDKCDTAMKMNEMKDHKCDAKTYGKK